MPLVARLLTWALAQVDGHPHGADRPSQMVLLTTLNGTSIRGLLIGRYASHFVFADGATVMTNGSTQWRGSRGHLEVPREQIDYYFVEHA